MDPIHIDIIILSYAKDEALKETTEQAIQSLMASEDNHAVIFDILVLESNRTLAPFQFSHSKTIYPEVPFGFNRYLNIGIKQTKNRYICLCNNDLIFHPNWASIILNVFEKNPQLYSANPYCDEFNYDKLIVSADEDIIFRSKNPEFTGGLTGWCIFVRRDLFDTIGLLDEQFEFWYADNDYDLTLKKHHIEHALIKSSKVSHVSGVSHDLLDNKKNEMTFGQQQKFEKKWRKKFTHNLYKKIKDKLFKK